MECEEGSVELYITWRWYDLRVDIEASWRRFASTQARLGSHLPMVQLKEFQARWPNLKPTEQASVFIAWM